MDADTKQMMQEALQAAVARISTGNGSGEPRAAPPMDTIGALMSIVPKLLQNSETDGEMLEKLEALQKGDLTPMRREVQFLRKQCHRLLKTQEQLMEKLEDAQRHHTAIAEAVLDLAHQMARIRIIDAIDEDDDGQDEPLGRASSSRAGSRTNRPQPRHKGREGH